MHLTSYGDAIRVILADDHPTFRNAFEGFLKKIDEVVVIGTASNGDELVQLVEKERPDIVVTDLKMPHLGGVEATKILKSKFPEIGIIALTLYSDDYLILSMLQAGADGYLLKSMLESEVVEAIKTVFHRGICYCDVVSNRLLKLLLTSSRIVSKADSNPQLSEKEIKVIKLICEQLSNKEIAWKLNIPLRTVENCRERIQEKIGAKNMAGIVTYAIKSGIYDVG
jgi:DNA-binding NarL/FixJ family response regulator